LKSIAPALLLTALGCGLILLPVGEDDVRTVRGSAAKVEAMELSAFSDAPIEHPLGLVFIRHSVGGH
jgi:hypothetical protein